jgi:DNA-binding NarL/FixJ family response regulator
MSQVKSRKTCVRHRIYLIDDHVVVREGLRKLLDTEPDLEVKGAASGAEEALRAIPMCLPDLVVVDISLPGLDGLEIIKSLKAQLPSLLVLVLSMHDELLYAERVLRAGARGYVKKSDTAEQLLDAIRRVLAGEIFVSPNILSRMVLSLSKRRKGECAPGDLQRLSNREIEILRLIGQGVGTAEIAQRLGISAKTVETHRGHIRVKLSLKSGPELLRFALAHSSGGGMET